MNLAPLQAFPVAAAAFSAAFVEFAEAMTVVLAVGGTRGWRNALAGGSAAAVVLLGSVVLLRPLIVILPIEAMQAVIGALLVLFGFRWLRKAVLRAAGILALHDEDARFEEARTQLRRPERPSGWDMAGMATAFQITLLEGIEVVFIVVAIGAGRSDLLTAASLGAAAAFLVVVGLGVALHRPLSRLPENALKFVVGVILCAFGTFWVGEGTGLVWPGGDWTILALGVGFLLTGLLSVRLCRTRAIRELPAMAVR